MGFTPTASSAPGCAGSKNNVSYVLDGSDYADAMLPAAEVDVALDAGYQTWNTVRQSGLMAARTPDTGGNFDILDAVVLDGTGNCVQHRGHDHRDRLISYDPATGSFEESTPQPTLSLADG